ncbi:MAG: AAA family ATPase [Victivallales bacterium]|nr:AAA family ATPase [Victivallales bacterium]
MKKELVDKEKLSNSARTVNSIRRELDRIMLGHEKLHKLVLTAVLSKGHVLLEGLPGVGKTEMIKSLGEILGLEFKRVQFTPDLMPSDILGTNFIHEIGDGAKEMIFQPGPVFTNILLGDEINRASPKTQSALLEAMQEGAATLLGTTRQLPAPFFVLASQNPIEMEGTYPIPEAQIDRFMFKLKVDAVESAKLTEIITTRRRGETPSAEYKLAPGELDAVFAVMREVFLPTPVANYISRLTAATHPGNTEAPESVNAYVNYGASPRAAIAMAEAARAAALFDVQPAAGFDHVRQIVEAALNHRIILNYKAKLDDVSTFDIIRDILEGVDEAGVDLPENLTIQTLSSEK